MRIPQILFTHLALGGHLHCFQLLAIVNSAAVDIGAQAQFESLVFNSFRKISRRGIAGLYGHPMFRF